MAGWPGGENVREAAVGSSDLPVVGAVASVRLVRALAAGSDRDLRSRPGRRCEIALAPSDTTARAPNNSLLLPRSTFP